MQWDVFQSSIILSLISIKHRKTNDLVQKPVHRPALIKVLIALLVYVLPKPALDCHTGKPKWPFHDEEIIALVQHELLTDSDLPNTGPMVMNIHYGEAFHMFSYLLPRVGKGYFSSRNGQKNLGLETA